MKGPLAARPDMYKLSGEAAVGNFGWAGVENNENLDGPRSIAVPGAVAGLCEAHERLGKLPLQEVVAPAVLAGERRSTRRGGTPVRAWTHGVPAPRI